MNSTPNEDHGSPSVSHSATTPAADLTTSTLPPPPALRVRLGVIIVILQWLPWLIIPLFAPDSFMIAVMAGAIGGLAVLVWWLFLSRAPWVERLSALVLIVAAVIATKRIVHPSIANGMMGLMLPIYSLPLLSLALVAWAVASRPLAREPRRASFFVALALACGATLLVRTDGLAGNGVSDLHWRWTPTPEERLLATAPRPSPRTLSPSSAPTTLAAPTATTPAAWPGFRGPQRDGVVLGTHLATDWTKSAPVELWRKPIGPAWSSFAVEGNFVYTQEQRGEDELVSCYLLTTGAPVWSHTDRARFWESNAGAGPRGTPTLHGGRVYTFGGTGILNALDARDGSVIWSRNAASDTARKTPDWGFASSPLVVGDTVIIATAGVLASYDLATGKPRWTGPKGGWGYSSPHLATIAGVPQIVLLNGAGAIAVTPADGQLLWTHEWKSDAIVQPVVLADGDILIGSGSGLGAKIGVRRIAIAHGAAGWTTEERWTSIGLKPYFNDFVVHRDHAYGFDGTTLACIELKDGDRQWKGGRYGNGQLILLADQDLLLVLSEKGDIALARAAPGEFTELARLPAIEGKTWNHPVLAGTTLLVRNDREMVAFRLP